MVRNISDIILNMFIKKGAIEDEFEVYRYGIEVIVSNSLGILGVMFIATISNLVIEGITFIIVFAKIRSYIGGYHCNTYLACNLMYISCFIVFVLFNSYFSNQWCITLTAISFMIIALFGPVDHYNKRLDDDEKAKYKKLGILYFLLFVICSFIFIQYLKVIQYALITSVLLMILGREKNRYESIKNSSKIC